MITYVVSDLFLSPAPVLVNTVNTIGVMGKGIAKDFKRIYPEMFKEYLSLCESGWLEVGKLHMYKTPNKWVLNFPTKRHWREPSQVPYIRAGLEKFVNSHQDYGITCISFPQLGCGNGELDWESQVRPVMEEYLGQLPVTAFVHLANVTDPFTPEHRDVGAIKKWLRQEPESLAFAKVWEDLSRLLTEPQHLETRDHSVPFTARIDTTTDDLILTTEDGEQRIPSYALIELWQLVRRSGFVAGSSLPSGLHTVYSYLLTLLSNLPYLEPVIMSDRHDAVTHYPLGLRFQPRPTSSQLPLLAAAGVVEPV